LPLLMSPNETALSQICNDFCTPLSFYLASQS